MSVNGISNTQSVTAYSTIQQNNNTAEKKEAKKSSEKDTGVLYEKSTYPQKATYAKPDVVARLKADAEQRNSQLRSLVEQMMTNQGAKIGQADDMWKFLAGGNFTVSAEAKAAAQAAIADDGYWGVEKTSDRIIEFAKSLVGDDPGKAEEMRAAFEKGFKAATKSWGQDLPDISQRTYDAVMQKFDDWAGVSAEG